LSEPPTCWQVRRGCVAKAHTREKPEALEAIDSGKEEPDNVRVDRQRNVAEHPSGSGGHTENNHGTQVLPSLGTAVGLAQAFVGLVAAVEDANAHKENGKVKYEHDAKGHKEGPRENGAGFEPANGRASARALCLVHNGKDGRGQQREQPEQHASNGRGADRLAELVQNNGTPEQRSTCKHPHENRHDRVVQGQFGELTQRCVLRLVDAGGENDIDEDKRNAKLHHNENRSGAQTGQVRKNEEQCSAGNDGDDATQQADDVGGDC
jgi:hypothetical protein